MRIKQCISMVMYLFITIVLLIIIIPAIITASGFLLIKVIFDEINKLNRNKDKQVKDDVV